MATVAPRLLGPADHGSRLTLEEFEQTDVEPGYLCELARGVLEVSEVPEDNPHGLMVFWFYQSLGLYHRDHPGKHSAFRRRIGVSARPPGPRVGPPSRRRQ